MAKQKDVKTNAMRILDREKVPYRVNSYHCEDFIDGVHIADMLGQEYARSFKTLVTTGRSGEHYVFALPVDRELDLKKAAKAVGEKSVEMLPVKEIQGVTGYIRGGCTPIGMKKHYKTVVHVSALQFDEIIISGGRLGLQLLLSPRDLQRVSDAEFEDIIIPAGK